MRLVDGLGMRLVEGLGYETGLITGGVPLLVDCETCDYSISFSAEEPPEYSKATKYPVSCSCLHHG